MGLEIPAHWDWNSWSGLRRSTRRAPLRVCSAKGSSRSMIQLVKIHTKIPIISVHSVSGLISLYTTPSSNETESRFSYNKKKGIRRIYDCCGGEFGYYVSGRKWPLRTHKLESAWRLRNTQGAHNTPYRCSYNRYEANRDWYPPIFQKCCITYRSEKSGTE